jgi:DNA repair protein RadC
MALEERPREKMLKQGEKTLSNAELLAILLRTGTKNKNAIELANYIINKDLQGIRYLQDITIEELCEIDGIGLSKAAQIKAALELGLEEVPCVIADDLNEEQIKAFRLVDNKVSEYSQWNFELLEEEMKELDIDMGDFGFESLNDLTDDDFIQDTEITKEKENKTIICPNCGMEFNV